MRRFRASPSVPSATPSTDCKLRRERGGKLIEGMNLVPRFRFRGGPISRRYVLAHRVEETGRHAGHLDILTELVDSRTDE